MTALAPAFVLMMTAGQASAAIAVDNDVSVNWQDDTPIGCDCSVELIGAPRLIRNTSEALERLKIAIHFNRNVIVPAMLSLSVSAFDTTGGRILRPDNDRGQVPVQLSFSMGTNLSPINDSDIVLDLRDFRVISLPVTTPADLFSKLPQHLILTVTGQITGTNTNNYAPGIVARVTFYGPGAQVLIDRVGDKTFQRGNALDVPPRSMPVVRALGELESRRLQGVDLDRGGRTARAVGFTHAFDLPPGARIVGGVVRVRVVGRDPGHSSNLVLLDQGVRDVIAGERVVPVISFMHLPRAVLPANTSEFELSIDLGSVPVTFHDPLRGHRDTPASTVLDLRAELDSGRLNVIIVGDVGLDYSSLNLTFHDPREDEVPQ
jgi:hypothetical protein